jgi:hypothetical protein
MTKSRNLITKRRPWLDWELQLLRDNYADSLTADLAEVLGRPRGSVHQKANALGLFKSPAMLAETARERTSRPGHGSHNSRFQPGLVPANKGAKGVTGHQPGCRATQFKPGDKPHTWVPIGSHRICEGQLQRKVNDLPGPNHIRWHPVSRLVWEKENGPVPSGHIVVFRLGMQTTELELITTDRLELLTRAELLTQRNGIHAYGPEIARVHQLRGVMTRTIRKLTKDHPHEQ